MSNDIFYLQLSFDEFAFLQARLIVPPLLGMGNMIFPPDTTEEVGMARLQAGSASLLARGYIERGQDNTVQVDSAIFGMMSVFAMARMAAMVYTVPSIDAEAVLHTYYFSPKLAVEHTFNSDESVHYFATTHRPDRIMDVMMDRMGLHDTDALQCQQYDLPGDVFQAVSNNTRAGNPKDAVAAYIKGGVAPQEAEALVQVMQDGGPQNTVVLMQSANPQDKRPGLDTGGTFVLYQNADYSFRVTPTDQHALLEPIANRDVFESLLNRVTPIFATENLSR